MIRLIRLLCFLCVLIEAAMTVHVTVFAGQMALVVSAALVAYSGAGDLACCLSAVVVHAGVCCRRGSCRCVWLELGAGHIVSEAEGMWCGVLQYSAPAAL